MVTFGLRNPSESARATPDLNRALQPVLQGLLRDLGYRHVMVAVLNAEDHTVEDVVGINIPPGVWETLYAPDGHPTPVAEALLAESAVTALSALKGPRASGTLASRYRGTALESFAIVPFPGLSAILLVSKGRRLRDAEVAALLPYLAPWGVALWEHRNAGRWQQTSALQAAENGWLWWMLNTVTDPVVMVDDQNDVVIQNSHGERLLKVNEEDSEGRRHAIELNLFLLSAALSSFALDQGTSMGRELTLVDPEEGSELLFEVICRPAVNPRTGEHALIAVLKNVTDLRRAGEEIGSSLRELQQASEEARHERDRLNQILDNVADPIVVTDPSNEILLMNSPARGLLQASQDHPSAPGPVLANETRLTSFLLDFGLDQLPTRQGEVELVNTTTNEPQAMAVTATKIRNDAGQVTANVSVLHDLTQVRELERRRMEQLLFESEKLAAVGRLAASVAHEINNPLESIKNALHLTLAEAPKRSNRRELLEIANSEVNRVSRIIRQMLGLYRGQENQVPTDINQIIEDSLGLLRPQLRNNSIQVSANLAKGIPSVLAVPDQLKQVFLNLFLNAQQAMSGGGELHIVTRLSGKADVELAADKFVLAEVRDTGAGIAKEHLHQIFDPFFSTKVDQRGTGLGLWVSKDIINRHHGQLTVRSRTGHGAAFTVTLPVGETYAASGAPAAGR